MVSYFCVSCTKSTATPQLSAEPARLFTSASAGRGSPSWYVAMKSRVASKVSQNIPCALYGSSARGDCAKTAQSAAVNASPFQSIGLLLDVALGERVGAGGAAETFVAVAPTEICG